MSPAGDFIPDILAMMKSGKFDLSPLVSHKYRLNEIEDALRKAHVPEDAQKVVIDYT